MAALALGEGSSRKGHTSGVLESLRSLFSSQGLIPTGVEGCEGELVALGRAHLHLLTFPGAAPGAPSPAEGGLPSSGVTTPTPCSCSALLVWLLLPLSLPLFLHAIVVPLEVPPPHHSTCSISVFSWGSSVFSCIPPILSTSGSAAEPTRMRRRLHTNSGNVFSVAPEIPLSL